VSKVRIATWNVNSLRSRIDRVEALLQRHDIDVLACQETKAREDQLPLMGLQAAGYDVAAAGTSQWNGVALISRVGLDDVQLGFEGMPGYGDPLAAEARAIAATCGGVRIWSLYVPNGRKPEDPHYVYKLDWLARLRDAAGSWMDTQTALVGDWNICPTDADVFDPAQFRNSTHVTPQERAAFQAFLDDGYVEVTRAEAPGYYWDMCLNRSDLQVGLKCTHSDEISLEHIPRGMSDRHYQFLKAELERQVRGETPEHARQLVANWNSGFTYWDYYRQRYERGRGMRIDLVLASRPLADRVTSYFVDVAERGGDDGHGRGASDHAPVIIDVQD
jgi:exodeoxyribonuclease III